MKRRRPCVSACLALLVVLSVTGPAAALDEADRLWLVGEKAFADGLYPVARRTLERFVTQFPTDPRLPEVVLLLGKTRLQVGDATGALEAFNRARTYAFSPGQPQELRFWEGEALFRLKRFAEARAAYDEVLRADAAGPVAADALYGRSWSDLELKNSDAAAAGFRELIATWPNHTLVPSATFQQARILGEQKKPSEAVALLQDFPTKYPNSALKGDALYLSGRLKIDSGDPKAGLEDLRQFVAGYPDHAQAPMARKLIAQASGRDDLEKASAAFKQKNWKLAVSHATAATKTDDNTMKSEAWLLVGESELKQKRFAPAAKAFEAVTAIDDVEAGVKFRALAGLGLAREEQQQWKAALTAYETVAKRSPDATLRDWAKQRAVDVKSRMANPAPAPSTKPAPKKDTKS